MTRAEYIKESNNPNSVRLDEMQKYEDTLEPHTRARLSLDRLFQMANTTDKYGARQMCKDYTRVCDCLNLTREYLRLKEEN